MDYDKLIEPLRRRGLGNGSALMLIDRLAALRGPTRELLEAGDTGRDMGAARKNRLEDG